MNFKVAISSLNWMEGLSFVKLESDDIHHLMQFTPNDDFHFTIKFEDGTFWQPKLPEKFSPQLPEDLIQISALFSLQTFESRK